VDIDSHLPTEPQEVATEIASILSGGCFRYLKSKRMSGSSEHSVNVGDVAQVNESEPFTENRLDSPGRRSLHSEAT
jgi:hypothetical protein